MTTAKDSIKIDQIGPVCTVILCVKETGLETKNAIDQAPRIY